ncbi:hypothetical protein DL93DRAFT_1235644 [Clavulina sp. PMI_390]|nr:hypothetical protein DL93DRAFT_1235644 [Clavulina sp. PMI_390]
MTILRLSSPVQRACSRSAQKGNYRLRREYAAQYIGRSAMSSSSSNVVSAYFAICFPSFTYYVTTLSCTIGRRSVPNHSPDAVPVHVDIDLGPLKSVSRLHARIEYDEDSDCFVICILGRNGAWIDGVWARSGSRVPLGTKTSIQIASRTFQFLLATPSHPPPADSGLELSPTPSVVDIVEAESSLREQLTPAPPSLSLSSLCCHAIDAAGGKATLGQIRRWLIAEYEWYRINEGWQVCDLRVLFPYDS